MRMQNIFTWHLKLYAGGPAIFLPDATIIKNITVLSNTNSIFWWKGYTAVLSKQLLYDNWNVVVVFDAPWFIQKFSVALFLLMPERFCVICISLFAFGFGDAIMYFVILKLLYTRCCWLSTFPKADIFSLLIQFQVVRKYW